MALKEVDVLIQGAGIGGLTLALALTQKGFSVHILERQSCLSEIGAGIWMAQNAMQVLSRLGVAGEIEQAGWPIRSIEISDFEGKVLQSLDLMPYADKFGFDTIAIHRAHLQKILFSKLPVDAVTFGCRTKSFVNLNDKVATMDSMGREWMTSFLVGADGLRSEIREKLLPETKIRYSGSSSYRAICHPQDARLFSHKSAEIWAPGCRFGFSPISKNSFYWYLTFDSAANENRSPANNHGHATSLIQMYFPDFKEVISVTAPEDIIRTDICDLKPLHTWGDRRVILIGDASHATTPNLGQGGAQAVEDGLALSEEIKRLSKSQEVLSAFFKRRRKKAKWIVDTSWSYRKLCHVRNPFIRNLRNVTFPLIPQAITKQQLNRMYIVT